MDMRVLVVDDAALFRRLISDVLAAMPGVQVAGTAADGKKALAQIASLKPDLITLDIEMPEMNGLEVLEQIRKTGMKTAALMLSSRTIRGGELTIRALELGAFDFIPKPEGGSPQENLEQLRDSLIPIVKSFQRQFEVRSLLGARGPAAAAAAPGVVAAEASTPIAAPVVPQRRLGSPIVLIGVSTGGPQALARVLPGLPKTLSAPVFIVQHMPPLFTEALAARLNSISAIRVKEGENGEIARNGFAYIAPGGKQMKLVPGQNGEIMIRLTDDPPENECRPAVDYLFRSAALKFPGRSVAVILTGMGKDGTEGLRLLKRSACSSIAQDEASCVVYGMPREAVLAGVIDTVVPLEKIATSIVRGVAGATV